MYGLHFYMLLLDGVYVGGYDQRDHPHFQRVKAIRQGGTGKPRTHLGHQLGLQELTVAEPKHDAVKQLRMLAREAAGFQTVGQTNDILKASRRAMHRVFVYSPERVQRRRQSAYRKRRSRPCG